MAPLAQAPHRFDALLAAHHQTPLRRKIPTTLQINLGKRCNQTCTHCHVDAGPQRQEMATRQVVNRVLELVKASPSITTVDITGGAPELNPHFRFLVEKTRDLDKQVIARCNLTILQETGQEDLGEFYARYHVKIVASLPCYTASNTDAQRGRGVFEKSVHALQHLNALGYGAAEDRDETGLRLDLAYNPGGPVLPGPQAALEKDYRLHLFADWDIRFNHLLTVTNMPIHRFADDLERQGILPSYLDLLAKAFNKDTLDSVMCRDLVSVNWDGSLSDCDFNQMLEMPLGGPQRTIFNLENLDGLAGNPIRTDTHCLGCTAGQGSGCTGALLEN